MRVRFVVTGLADSGERRGHGFLIVDKEYVVLAITASDPNAGERLQLPALSVVGSAL